MELKVATLDEHREYLYEIVKLKLRIYKILSII